MRQAVIDLAVRKFKANTDVEVTVEDCLIWSMEHYDTDDMTQEQYDTLLNDVKGRI